MRAVFILSTVAMAALTLGGCMTGQDFVAHDPFLYRDPLVNGPFLIGPQRPNVVVGDCRPLNDIRSQDARLGYKPCPRLHPYGGAINPQDPPVGVVTEKVGVPEDEDGTDLKAPPYSRSVQPRANTRSAW